MIVGNLPGLALNRTGIALLGAIAFIGLENLNVNQISQYVDFSALAILFSFMIISAQFYYSGFYTYVVDRIEKWPIKPQNLLLIVILICGFLSAILLNDIVCFALTPLIIRGCVYRKLNPIPFLLGLATGSNIGSALTLVGNPQNLLIGQVLNIPFGLYLKYSFVPCVIGLFATWFIIKLITRDWFQENPEIKLEAIPFNFWQSGKGIVLILTLLVVFFVTDLPRDQMALIAAGFILLSRKMASQTMLSFIDWQLLVLFIGLFIVNRSFLNIYSFNFDALNIQSPFWLFLITAALSNIISNVPAVMLLLPFVKTSFNGSVLALSSTIAGNLLIVGSIATMIVILQAKRFGIKISWKKHLQVGLPVTLVTFIIVALWLYLMRP